MENSLFHKLSRVLWGIAVIAVVLVALYVSLGRYLMSNIGGYQDDILSQLNARLPFTIEAREVRGDWRTFNPELVFTDLKIVFDDPGIPPVELAEGRFTLDAFHTLNNRQLTGRRVQLRGLSLSGAVDVDGRITIAGFGGGGGGQFRAWFENFLRNVERLELVGNRLDLAFEDGDSRSLSLDLQLDRMGSQRILASTLTTAAGVRIDVAARGVGNPFNLDTYDGDLHARLRLNDIDVLSRFLPDNVPVRASGEGELQLWVSWASGEPEVKLALASESLDLRRAGEAGSAQVPLEALQLTASLQRQRDRWTAFMQDVQIAHQGNAVELPRLQADLRENSLRLRAEAIELAPLNAFLTSLEPVPTGLASVFDTLSPSGRLVSAEFNFESLQAMADNWALEASFEDVAVESWRGAPGVRGAQGFLDLRPGSGWVLLDSAPFSMAFPTVYDSPLVFDDFGARISIDWDKEALQLGSSLVRAAGAEGDVRALFGLTVPFSAQPQGIEMELLVGLSEADPIHRNKYLPYTLNEGLLSWLRQSIGEGDVNTGAFLWRGSLKGKGGAPYRTVQLGFDLANTALTYSPDWPAISRFAGTVLIDDARVSVWADQAQLLDSHVQSLSVETWRDSAKEIQLKAHTVLGGPAADGLTVINGSPIATLTNNAFEAWTLSGDLETTLDLALNLNRPGDNPGVDVRAILADAELGITPINLDLYDVAGTVSYSGTTGLRSDDLRGVLWDRPVSAAIAPAVSGPASSGVNDSRPTAEVDSGQSTPPGAQPVRVSVSGDVHTQALTDWLSLPALELAQGVTPVDITVDIPQGETPKLTATTSLSGVSLDLPLPWRKSAEEQRELQVTLPLTRERLPIELRFEDIQLSLALASGQLEGASLYFGNDNTLRTQDRAASSGLLISGRAPSVDVQSWLDFAEQYFSQGNTPDPNAPEASVPEFPITAKQFFAEDVLLWGRRFTDTSIDLTIADQRWDLAVKNALLEGALAMDYAAESGDVALSYLNLSELSADQDPNSPEASPASTVASDESAPLQLPALSVTVDELRYQGNNLGNLELALRSSGPAIVAEQITGEIAGFALQPQAPGELVWRQGTAGQADSTRVRLPLSFGDIGDSFDQLGYQRILETESGRSEMTLLWPGGPEAFDFDSATGRIELETSEGRFLSASSGTSGALRVVSILNLADIVRRLSLSHTFESGIPFEQLTSQVFLNAGKLEVPSMQVRGAGSGFQFSGVSDLVAGTIDGELVVTLPVANNLPWMAALAAGLPVAAGVFVVSRVFQDQVNRFTSGVYTVEGALDNPTVSFDRIFDNASAASSIVGGSAEDPNSVLANWAPLPGDAMSADPNRP